MKLSVVCLAMSNKFKHLLKGEGQGEAMLDCLWNISLKRLTLSSLEMTLSPLFQKYSNEASIPYM